MRRLIAVLGLLLFISPLALAIPAAMIPQSQIVKFGENIYIPKGAEVDSAVAIGGSVDVAGSVKDDVVAVGGNVVLQRSALVGGNAVSVGGNITKFPGAVVKGESSQIMLPADAMAKGAKMLTLGGILLAIMSFISFFVLAILLVAFYHKQIGIVSYYVEKETGHALLWGLLAVVLIPLITLLMIASLIGIVFVPLFLLLVAAACVFGYIAGAQLLGKRVFKAIRQTSKPMTAETVLGLFLLFLVSFLPIMGCIVTAVVGICGLGSVMVTRFGTVKK